MTDTERSLMATSIVITNNLFDEVYKSVSEGYMATLDKICDLAYEFEQEFKKVKWGESEKYEVWDEFLVNWVENKLKL